MDVQIAHWTMEQAGMYQTRLAVLSKVLSVNYDVAPVLPSESELICAKSTQQFPLHCRVYIEPEVGSKWWLPADAKAVRSGALQLFLVCFIRYLCFTTHFMCSIM